MPPSHITYGPHLEDYTSSYTLEACRRELRRDPNCILSSVYGAIGYALHLPENLPEDTMDLSVLKTLPDYTLSSDSIGSLASPIMAKICIKMMEKMYSQEQSIFRYEYGFLCFRVFTISHALCFLKQHGRLEELTEAMDREPHREVNELLTQTLCQFIVDDFEKENGKAYCAWIHQSDRSSHPVTCRQIYALIRMLYHDRKLFFASLAKTHGPGLSVLFFAMLQYLRYEEPEPLPDSMTPSSLVYDLLFRYLIVLPWDERPAISFIRHMLSVEHSALDVQIACIDIEDSRKVLSAFTQFFDCSCPYYLNTIDGLASALQVVVAVVMPGCRDLLPGLFRTIVNQMWDATINQDLTQGDTLKDCVWQTILMMSSMVVSLLNESPIAQAIILEIIEVFAQCDFIDLLVRIAFTLSPQMTPSAFDDWTKAGENTQFRMWAVTLCQKLGDFIRRGISSKPFFPLLDWFKYENHAFQSMLQHDPSSQEHDHYALCIGFLHNLRETVSDDDSTMRGFCGRAGCPAPPVSSVKKPIGSVGYINIYAVRVP